MFSRTRSLEEALGYTEKMIWGVPFKLRSFDYFRHIDGHRQLVESFRKFSNGEISGSELVNNEAIHQHMKDVIFEGVVTPKLVKKQGENGFWIDELFKDLEFTAAVYTQVCKNAMKHSPRRANG